MKDAIKKFVESPDRCGLEVYIVTKVAPRLKRMNFYDLRYSYFTPKIHKNQQLYFFITEEM